MMRKGSIPELAADGTTDQWIAPNFKPGSYKNNRRLLFFPDSGTQPKPWSQKASADPNPFANEQQLAKQNRQRKKEPAKKTRAKRATKAATGTRKKAVKKKVENKEEQASAKSES